MSFSLADRTQATNNKTEITNGSVGCCAHVVHICTSKSFVASAGADTQKLYADEVSLVGQKVRSLDKVSLIGQKIRSFVWMR